MSKWIQKSEVIFILQDFSDKHKPVHTQGCFINHSIQSLFVTNTEQKIYLIIFHLNLSNFICFNVICHLLYSFCEIALKRCFHDRLESQQSTNTQKCSPSISFAKNNLLILNDKKLHLNTQLSYLSINEFTSVVSLLLQVNIKQSTIKLFLVSCGIIKDSNDRQLLLLINFFFDRSQMTIVSLVSIM